jgi:lantibiotic leader peptide-processing serine protease
MKKSLSGKSSFASLIVLLLIIAGCIDHPDNPNHPITPETDVFGGILSKSPMGAELTGKYIIVGQASKLPANLESDVRSAGGNIVRTIPNIGIAIAEASDPGFTGKTSRIRGIESVIPDVKLQWIDPLNVIEFNGEVADPPFSGSADFFFDLQWGHAAVGATSAWYNGVRGQGVRVAVLDTGFDLTHPDLAPNINLPLSANFVSGETLQYGLPDPFSHGSHVAGTIGAAENDFGIIGVAPEVELILVKVLRDAGSGSFADVISGIIHATNVGADIINMSLVANIPKRGIYDDDGNRIVGANDVAALLNAINRATKYAYMNGTTIIASAGNDAINSNQSADLVQVPSQSVNVIAISATAPIGWATDPLNTSLDNPASYTNYGLSHIDFAAPGGDFIYPGNEDCNIAGLVVPCWVFDLVFSTGNQSWYWSAGTSMAAPHASGIAALIIGENGGSMRPTHVERELANRAQQVGNPGKDPYFGHGRVHSGH